MNESEEVESEPLTSIWSELSRGVQLVDLTGHIEDITQF